MTLNSKSDVGGFFFFFFFLLPVQMAVVLLKTSKMPEGALALAGSKALPGTENKWVENKTKGKQKNRYLGMQLDRVPESH